MSGKAEKPSFQKITPTFGSSIYVKQYVDRIWNKEPYWHFHPEMELIYIEGGSGRRHIGNHLSYFQDGDLIFIGANLPHYGFTDRLTGNKRETVVQMTEDFLGETFLSLPELHSVRVLFEKAKRGLVFHGLTKSVVGAEIEKLAGLHGFDRLMQLIKIFQELSISTEYTLLNADGYSIEIQAQDSDRMNIIYNFVRTNFKVNITLDEIADEVSMTVPAFCRYFKKMTNKTFTEFVNEYRLIHSSKLLLETAQSISLVCMESGFNNFSHFNKVFKKYFGKSPSAFRKGAKRIVGETLQ